MYSDSKNHDDDLKKTSDECTTLKVMKYFKEYKNGDVDPSFSVCDKGQNYMIEKKPISKQKHDCGR